MNIVLVPYTRWRHLVMALWCGGAGLLAWFLVLSLCIVGGPKWPMEWDGPLLLSTIAAFVAGASVLGEGNLSRRPMLQRLGRTGAAMALALGNTLLWYWVWTLLVPYIMPSQWHEDAADLSLVSLRYRIGALFMAGMSTGIAGAVVRKLENVVSHIAGGVSSAVAAGATWHVLGANFQGLTDLYLASASLGLVWGLLYGLITWPVPDSLYAGWIRVLAGQRVGRRIPIPAADGAPKERFVGHFPRGLDLFLPVEGGVTEMHVSVAVDAQGRYVARGLAQAPTVVRRFLERIDLRYDPRRPAPLETRLSSGDRIQMGQGPQQSELEFLMLPREES